MMRHLMLCVGAAVFCAVPRIAAAQSASPDGLDRYIEQVRRDWDVVGLAVGIVKDGAVAYARGFGAQRAGDDAPVSEHTIFAIGSNTKAFTAAGLGILVDEGRLAWDDRVIDRLPAFRLYDPYVTRELSVRDLLSHRSGLGRRGDANWYGTDFDREEIVRRIRFLKPNASFRAEFGYQNTMFLVAGEVTEAVANLTWDAWMRQRLLAPLGMTRSSTTTRALDGMTDVASPHVRSNGAPLAVPYRNLDNIAPAGSINSSVIDMTRWMLLLLGEGEPDGRRLLSAEVVREMMTPQTLRRLSADARELFPSTHFTAYGLGLGLTDYRGRLVVSHTGGIDGMLSQVTLVPEERLGIVVLTNTSPNNAFSAITFHVLDEYLGAPERDWNGALLARAREEEGRAAEVERKRREARATGTRPTFPLDKYAGAYENDLYGTVTARHERGRLVLHRHTALVADLEHWHYDTFLVRWRDPVLGQGRATFRLNADGRVAGVLLEGLAEFTRVPEDEP